MAIDIQAIPAPAPSPPRRMTYEEFLARDSGDDGHYEWVDGEAIPIGTVSGEHSDLGLFLLNIFSAFIEAHLLGILRYDPFQMKTGPDLPGRSPDILFVANENAARLKKNYLDGPADLVVEIISPESRARDRGEKFYEYEQGGVREYWLLDPIRRQTEFYQRDANGIFQLVPPDANGIYRSAILPGLRLDVNWLWQKPLPTLMSVLKAWELV